MTDRRNARGNDQMTRIRVIIAEQLGCDLAKVAPESRIVADLGADSLDLAELMLLLEEEIGVNVPEEAAMSLETVADVVALAERIVADSPLPESISSGVPSQAAAGT